MRTKVRLVHDPIHAWTDSAVASLVGQTPAFGASMCTVIDAKRDGEWIVTTLDVPDDTPEATTLAPYFELT